MSKAASKLYRKELQNAFRDLNEVATSGIVDFYKSLEPKIKRSTIDWRIYQLVQDKILHRISRGRYSLSATNKQIYIPELDQPAKKVYQKIKSQLPFANFIVWQTKWLNEFMIHQPGKFLTIIEVEKDAKESVFRILQESKLNVFLSPSKEMIDNYLYSGEQPIIVQNLISEAPNQDIKKTRTATLEKMLIDIISDSNLYSTFQGRELNHIYQTAFDRYNISLSKMRRYSKRRNKTEKLESILRKTKIRH